METILAIFLAVVQIAAWITLFVCLILSPYLTAVTLIDSSARKKGGG